jgi:hypothetical protein
MRNRPDAHQESIRAEGADQPFWRSAKGLIEIVAANRPLGLTAR